MKIGWIAAAEQYLPDQVQRAAGGLLRLADGSLNWHPVSTAPFNRDVEIRAGGRHRLIPFPCRQTPKGWINSDLSIPVELEPVAWRAWSERRAESVRKGGCLHRKGTEFDFSPRQDRSACISAMAQDCRMRQAELKWS